MVDKMRRPGGQARRSRGKVVGGANKFLRKEMESPDG